MRVLLSALGADAADAGSHARDTSSQTASQQKPARVTTTVVVHGEVEDNYLPETVTVGTLDGGRCKDAPLSATVVTRDLLTDQVARLLSDVVNNDASVGERLRARGLLRLLPDSRLSSRSGHRA